MIAKYKVIKEETMVESKYITLTTIDGQFQVKKKVLIW